MWKKSQQKLVLIAFIRYFQEVEKQCRCGKHTKRMPCHKPYLCETKCVKMRDCQKHQCRRKVCVGSLGNCLKNHLEFVLFVPVISVIMICSSDVQAYPLLSI